MMGANKMRGDRAGISWVRALWMLAVLATVDDVYCVDPHITDSPMNAVTDTPLLRMKIESMVVESQVMLTYARTLVVSTMRNIDYRHQEAVFSLILPDTAFVTHFTMLVNGKPYSGFVRESGLARSMYAAAADAGLGTAHVAASVRDSNHFTISVSVEPFSNAVFYLTYEELLERKDNWYTHIINLYPGQIVPSLKVNIYIKEGRAIRSLLVPEMSTGASTSASNIQNHFAEVNWRSGDREAFVRFSPTIDDQNKLMIIYQQKMKEAAVEVATGQSGRGDGMLGQFIVRYDVNRTFDGELFVNDGHFIHFFNPPCLRPLNKLVVFTLDTSGSMGWSQKINQLRQAIIKILGDLRPQDYFAIIEFNSNAKVIHPTSRATTLNIKRAKEQVARLQADGGTNILEALQTSLREVQKRPPRTHDIPIIFFVTDGDPTEGETNTDVIISTIDRTNSFKRKAAIFTLAFGEDAKREFLEAVALRNHGVLKHIYQAGDAEQQLENFYKTISSPVMANVEFKYPSELVNPQYATKTIFHTVGNGSQAVVAGKFAGNNLTADKIDFVGTFDLEQKKKMLANAAANPPVGIKENFGPLERMWAYLNIKQLQQRFHTHNDQQARENALVLALKYQFVTELTSMVVVKPYELNDVVDTPPAQLSESEQMTTVSPAMLAANNDYRDRKEIDRLNRIIEHQSQLIKKLRAATDVQYQKYEQEKSMMRSQVKDLTNKVDRLEAMLSNIMSKAGP